jgi:hypothetical protein
MEKSRASSSLKADSSVSKKESGTILNITIGGRIFRGSRLQIRDALLEALYDRDFLALLNTDIEALKVFTRVVTNWELYFFACNNKGLLSEGEAFLPEGGISKEAGRIWTQTIYLFEA